MYIVLSWDPRVADLDPLLDQIPGDNGPTREQLRDAYVANHAKRDAVEAAIVTVLDSLPFVNRFRVFNETTYANVDGGVGDARDLQTALRAIGDPAFSFTITYSLKGSSIANSTDVDDQRLEDIANWDGS